MHYLFFRTLIYCTFDFVHNLQQLVRPFTHFVDMIPYRPMYINVGLKVHKSVLNKQKEKLKPILLLGFSDLIGHRVVFQNTA